MLGVWQFGLLGVVGGVLALDRTALLQAMVSRPLVGASLAGQLLGEPALGLLCGLLLELLWLMDLPVGGAVPADETVAGLLSAVFAASAPEGWSEEARAALGVFLALPFGVVGRRVDIAIRSWNRGLLTRVRANVEAGKSGGLAAVHLVGVLRFFLAGGLLTALGAAAGSALVGRFGPAFPAGAVAGLELAETALPLVGAGAVLAGFGGVRHAALFGVGLVGGVAATDPGTLRRLLEGRLWGR